jgi:hypothetical protein
MGSRQAPGYNMAHQFRNEWSSADNHQRASRFPYGDRFLPNGLLFTPYPHFAIVPEIQAGINRLEEGEIEDIVESRWLEIAAIYQNANISL